MRLALAVSAAGALDLAVLLRIDQWFGLAGLLAILYLFLASAGAGFFAGQRTALAGGLAVVAGTILSGLVQYAPRATYSNDLDVLLGFELQLLIAVVPYAIGGGVAGALGGALRRRVLRR
jgi:hypothetical protein